VFVTILVIAIPALGGIFYLTQIKKISIKSWIQFYTKGKDAGFSFREIELLRRLAVKNALADPASLFWSQKQLDACIKNLVKSARLAKGTDQASRDFLSRLYDYRKKIEVEKTQSKNGIKSSRQMEEGQRLQVLVDGQGVFESKLLKNTGMYLLIALPVSSSLPIGFTWTGLKISVYFWRKDDAGYVFDTIVQGEVLSKGASSLKAGHADSLVRTQKRRSIRIKTHKAAFLYILDGDEASNNIETRPGLKCFVEDLSDSGCAVLIGGRALVGLRIKVQFILNGAPVCVSGMVRSMDYRDEQEESLLHVEADPMPIETRNHILGEVFKMLPEEEEIPFQALGGEAAGEAADEIIDEITDETAVPEAGATADEAAGETEVSEASAVMDEAL